MPRHSDPKNTNWRKHDPRQRPGDRHLHPIRTFQAPDALMEPFKREVLRPGQDGKPFATGYGPACVRLIEEWLKNRGIDVGEIKRGMASALHPATDCFA